MQTIRQRHKTAFRKWFQLHCCSPLTPPRSTKYTGIECNILIFHRSVSRIVFNSPAFACARASTFHNFFFPCLHSRCCGWCFCCLGMLFNDDREDADHLLNFWNHRTITNRFRISIINILSSLATKHMASPEGASEPNLPHELIHVYLIDIRSECENRKEYSHQRNKLAKSSVSNTKS